MMKDELVHHDGQIASLKEIQDRIVLVRGVQVMLDRDLAMFYEVDTGQLNRQVKRNINRFPEDFMFKLTKEEWLSLKCQFGIPNTRGGDRSIPYVLTEQGISQLSGVFKKHNTQCSEIQKIQLSHQIHDRYLIIDNEVWILGASIKDIGHGLCTVIKVNFTPEMVLSLL